MVLHVGYVHHYRMDVGEELRDLCHVCYFAEYLAVP